MGTHAVTGQAKAVVVLTGKETEFGHISERLRMHVPETAFELRRAPLRLFFDDRDALFGRCDLCDQRLFAKTDFNLIHVRVGPCGGI